jgi:hypothetical protein
MRCNVCGICTLLYSHVQSAGPALDSAVSLVTGIHGALPHIKALHGTTIINTDGTSTDATATTAVKHSRNVDDTSPEFIREELGFNIDCTVRLSITDMLSRILIQVDLFELACCRICKCSHSASTLCALCNGILSGVCALYQMLHAANANVEMP